MATTITKTETLVGKRIRRKEDPRLITGTATYVDDIQMPGMHHAVHRPQPARRGQDQQHRHQSRAATSRRGRRLHRRRCQGSWDRSPAARRCPDCASRITIILAQDRVYFVGHPVAVVVATDRYIAATPPTWSKSSTTRCPPSPTPKKPSHAGAPAVHPEWPDNIAFTYQQEGGDVEQAFAEAEVVVKQRITSQRLIPTAMETRGVVAD